MTEPTILRFGRCEVHLLRHEVRLDEQVQAIAPKVYELLVFLLRQRHRVVQKRELIDVLWQRAVISRSGLTGTVMQARRVIGDVAAQPVWIKTIQGIGYRFVGEVQADHSPFEVLMNPTGLLDIVRKSSSIGMLRRRVFAKADAPRVSCTNLAAYDAEIEAEFDRKSPSGVVSRIARG